MNFFDAERTRVVGHRGSPTMALENTFESFDRAEADGADAFELDVRLTLDGEAVVHHDAEIVLGTRRVPLANVTIPELRETPIVRGELRGFAPTLRDVFLRYGSAGRYLVELKPGPAPRPGLLEFRVAALLVQLALLEKVVVLSFSMDALRRIREGSQERVDGGERRALVACALVQQTHAVHRIADGCREVRLERLRVVGRIGALRQRDDLYVEAAADGELHVAQRRLLPRGVGVEAEEQPLRQTPELLQLLLRERRSHRRDDG